MTTTTPRTSEEPATYFFDLPYGVFVAFDLCQCWDEEDELVFLTFGFLSWWGQRSEISPTSKSWPLIIAWRIRKEVKEAAVTLRLCVLICG